MITHIYITRNWRFNPSIFINTSSKVIHGQQTRRPPQSIGEAGFLHRLKKTTRVQASLGHVTCLKFLDFGLCKGTPVTLGSILYLRLSSAIKSVIFLPDILLLWWFLLCDRYDISMTSLLVSTNHNPSQSNHSSAPKRGWVCQWCIRLLLLTKLVELLLSLWYNINFAVIKRWNIHWNKVDSEFVTILSNWKSKQSILKTNNRFGNEKW